MLTSTPGGTKGRGAHSVVPRFRLRAKSNSGRSRYCWQLLVVNYETARALMDEERERSSDS
jgi:hypothetical protein